MATLHAHRRLPPTAQDTRQLHIGILFLWRSSSASMCDQHPIAAASWCRPSPFTAAPSCTLQYSCCPGLPAAHAPAALPSQPQPAPAPKSSGGTAAARGRYQPESCSRAAVSCSRGSLSERPAGKRDVKCVQCTSIDQRRLSDRAGSGTARMAQELVVHKVCCTACLGQRCMLAQFRPS